MMSNNNSFSINEQNCSICGGNVTKFAAVNIFNIKTAHSETPISEILERFKLKLSTDILNECLNDYCDKNKTCACNDCLIKIDEYDLAYTTAERIENELINLILNSNERKQKTDIFPVVSFKKDMDCNETTFSDIEVVEDEDNNDENDNYDEHFNSDELNESNFIAECKICDIKFNTIEELNQHEHHKTDSINHQSIIEMSSSKNNKHHKTVQLSGNLIRLEIECQSCNKIFHKKKEFMLHMREHALNENKKNKHQCEKCEKQFTTEVLLEIHQAVHEGRSELECPHCSRVLSTRGGMVKHLRIHSKDFKYQCELCGKQFLHDSSFRMHNYAHYNIRTVTCKLCNRRFRGTPHLNRHMRIHTGEKPFSCSICGRTFAQRYNMNMHYKSHSSNRKFECIDCELSFDSKKSLKEHSLSVHNLVLDTNKDKNKANRPRRIPVYETDEVKEACENIQQETI